MKLLVTGAAGFIGSHLTERLVARGDEVVGLDNFDPFYDRAIKERNVRGLDAGFRLVEGDILDAALLERLFAAERFDAVVHLAALAGVRPSVAAPWRYQRVNVEGTARVAEASIQHRVGRLVFASSSSVYGDNTSVPFRETDRVDLPASPYGASKRACELLLRCLHTIHGLTVCNLRFFTVYGPRQRPEMAIHKFVRLAQSGEPITLYGQGDSSRDYTYIDDIIEGVVGAVDRAPAGLSTYNLGNTAPIRLLDLVDRIGQATGRTPSVRHAAPQPGDVAHTWADVEAAGRDLGFRPSIGIDEGLARFVKWYRRIHGPAA